MSTDTIPARSNGQTIDQTWYNIIRTVLSADQVPRNTSGVAADLGGSLGQSALRWLKAFIASGYLSPGDIKAHHTYNGATPIGEGWFPCLGGIINQANYDAIFGSGHWATYVGSSPLDGKYAPNLTSRYLVGVSATTQSGSVAITAVGNSGNVSPGHHHLFIDSNGRDGLSAGFTASPSDGSHYGLAADTTAGHSIAVSANTANATDNIQPDSIEAIYYIRII